jgi:acetyl esterase/lipase
MTLPLVMNLLKIKGDTSGGDPLYPAEAVARAQRVSPINHVRTGLPPSLVIHGTDDTVIPVEQAHRFAAAMTDSGNRCDLIVLDGVRHAFVIVGIGTEETIVRALGETDSFLSSIGFMDDGSGIGMKE